MGFASSLRLNSRRLMARVNSKCYAIARELFTKVVDLTPSPSHPGPYAEGYLVNQWYPAEGRNFSSELGPEYDTGGDGYASRARIDKLDGYAFNGRDGAVTLANNVEYAYRAEALGWPVSDGWSGKIGPYRMVAKAIQIIGAKYK